MDNKLSVLIIEDEIKVAETIKAYLEKNGFNAYFSILGSAALNILNEKNINLIILDLMLPDMSGEEICKTIRKTSDVPIIVLTAKSSEDSKVNALNIGADDYLIKPFSPRELTARVKALLRRAGVFSENSAVEYNGGLSIDFTLRTVKKNGTEITLTPNEYKLLTFLAQNAGRYFSREDLIEGAIGAKYDGYDRAIDSHIKNLRHKIEDNPRSPRFILTQYGVGYKFAGIKQ
ncbi:MAG: response regulator transcription factor [Mucispirillum sp.]|nr:response regulator transcription factor [Mucispirillum sp.]